MKIAYVFSSYFSNKDGVSKKICEQISSWIKFGAEVRGFGIDLSNVSGDHAEGPGFIQLYKRSSNRIFGPNRLLKDVNRYKPDIVYFRHEIFKPFIFSLLRSYPTAIEYNSLLTSELKLLSRKSFYNSLKLLIYHQTEFLTQKNAAAFVGVTREILESEIHKSLQNSNMIVIPNSIDVEQVVFRKKVNVVADRLPRLFIMGSPNQPWHGVDKIFKCKEKIKDRIDVFVVGALGNNKPMVDGNIHILPFVKDQDLPEVVGQFDIAISTLALHRKEMNEACPLKSRQYLAWGFPMIYAYDDPAIPKSSNVDKYLLKIPNVEKNFEDYLESVIDFSYRMRDEVIPAASIDKLIGQDTWERQRLSFLESLIRGF